MKQNLHNIFNNAACPSSDDLQLYLRGIMSPEDANALEQHIEGCEMCADALEGLEAFNQDADLHGIKAELDLKVDALLQKDKRSILYSSWYKIAAAVTILAMVGGVLYMNNQFSTDNQKVFTEHYKPFEKKEDKLNALQNETEGDDLLKNSKLIVKEQNRESTIKDATDAVQNISSSSYKSIEPDPELANRKEVSERTPPPTAAIDYDLSADVAEVQEDLESPVEGVVGFEDEISARVERSNSTDYYLDGVQVQGKHDNEITVISSDKRQNAPAVQEVTVASDNKGIKALTRKDEKNAAQAEPATTIGNSKEAFFNGASQELITINYDKGEEEYENKNYAQASLWFQKVLEIDASHYQSNFYAGLCALQLQQAELSVDYLNKVIDKEKEVLYEPALWYISLAHIKLDDGRKARKYLKLIIPLNGEYKSEAEKLLKEL